MTFVPVKNIGSAGVVKDLAAPELPIGAWTDAQNVRFVDNSAQQFYGQGEIYASPSVVPYHVLPVTVSGVRKWIYAGAAKIYTVDAIGGVVTHTNITRQTASVDVDYTATRNSWTSTVLGGIPILNNGVDAPQYWQLTGKCAAVTAWPANTTCVSMRAFKNMLVALGVNKAGTNYPYMVKWSHPADPGSMPSTWDITDATKDAGEFDLSEGYDIITDALGLRDSLVIYKQASVWRLDYIGGVFVNKAQKVLGTSGAMNKNCIVELDGQHAVLTADDVIVHDGSQAVSVLDKQMRKWLFANIDSTYQSRCFVFKNPYQNEVFFCFPTPGNSTCNKALVWNWVDKTCTFRDLPNINHATNGALDSGLSQSIGVDTDPIYTDPSPIGAGDFSPDIARVVMAPDTTKLYELDASITFAGTQVTSYLERRGLHFDAPDKIKTVRGIRPRMNGTTGYTVNFQIGWANDPYSEPTYGTAVPFTIGTSVSVDTFATGRYMAIKISSGTAYWWKLDSYDWDVAVKGSW